MDFKMILLFISFILVFLVSVDIASGADCNQTLQCLTTFIKNYPQENTTNLLLSFPDEFEYICKTQRNNIDCVDKDIDSCPTVQHDLEANGINATKYRNFLRNKCPSYDNVFKDKKSCVKDGLKSPDYLPCTYKLTRTYPIPQDRIVTSCPLYNGILRCVDQALDGCGCPARDYLKDGMQIRWTMPTCTDEPKCMVSGAMTLTASVMTFTAAVLLYIKSTVVDL